MTRIKIALVTVALMVSGCRTRYLTREVPVPVTSTHSEQQVRYAHDTLHTHTSDSTVIMRLGDTVYSERYRVSHTIDRQVRVDTVIKLDTVTRPVTVTRTVTKETRRPLTRWQRLTSALGQAAIGGLTVIAAVLCIRIWRKYRGFI